MSECTPKVFFAFECGWDNYILSAIVLLLVWRFIH
jgi:hypothetical protein